ncbi:replication initiation protein RepC [Martelella alba]|uniref:Replication initiation protein RepC n=1 Tax=Martelella alba TaxID=2590451 RepID=A0A506TY14_9HYPH|nr:plasmid replication protein RepC [Martelella alba]TPW26973.1 replication initiation protein RepC [Martelella alba]
MEYAIGTTPFGRRAMTLGQMAAQVRARRVPDGASVDKWKVFHLIREARAALGATDRALSILNALLSFHPETTLAAGEGLIVWPSNEQLSARANGMPATTLRRHLAVLVDCGLILRRDSPNGKRYARKGRAGAVEQAFGFDLTPLVARADEFEALVETVRAEKRALKASRERLTLLRRDIVKMIETGMSEGVPGNWAQITDAYQAIMTRLPRSAPRNIIDGLVAELEDLWVDLHDHLNSFIKDENMDANAHHNGAHIQNSKPDSLSDSENGFGKNQEADGRTEPKPQEPNLPKRELTLGLLLKACPDLLDHAAGGKIASWRDFLEAAEIARPMLGISPSAWQKACRVMGDISAAVTLAAILQRADQIGSPGGYLRNLTQRAEDGKFSTFPMVMALLNHERAGGAAARPDPKAQMAALGISPALAKRVQGESWNG